MKIVKCDETFAGQILEIFNEAILNSTALYDYKPRNNEVISKWFEIKNKGDFPIVGLVDDKGKLLAFGSYGTFRAWPAYKYTVEHSVYVEKSSRGKGYGKTILTELIKKAENQNYHCLIAGIDSSNNISIEMHKKLGFTFCGQIKQVGFKFGRWLDLDFYQLLLKTPLQAYDE
jgi:L-amino acid N-acyltransferase YncA